MSDRINEIKDRLKVDANERHPPALYIEIKYLLQALDKKDAQLKRANKVILFYSEQPTNTIAQDYIEDLEEAP